MGEKLNFTIMQNHDIYKAIATSIIFGVLSIVEKDIIYFSLDL